MKKIITILVLIIASNSSLAQNINLNLIYQIIKVDFNNIDELMIKGYGFEKVSNEQSGAKQFFKIYNNDRDYAIIITKYNNDFRKNDAIIIDIKLAKGYSTRIIKDDLVQDGFIFWGYSKELDSSVYRKGNLEFIFSEYPNKIGARQILVMTFSQ